MFTNKIKLISKFVFELFWKFQKSTFKIDSYALKLRPGVRILISPLFCRIWENEKPLFKLKFACYFCIWKKLQNAKCKKFFLRVSGWRDVKAEKKWKMKNAKLFFCRFHAFDWKIKSSQIAFCGAEKLDSTRRQRASQRLITRVGTSLLTGSEIWLERPVTRLGALIPPSFGWLLEQKGTLIWSQKFFFMKIFLFIPQSFIIINK